MSNETQSASPGWYPSPEGGQRYWDGRQWLDLPEPSTVSPGDGSSRRESKVEAVKRFLKRPIALTILAVVVLGSIGVVIAVKMSHDSKVEEERRVAAAAAQEEADRAATAAAAKKKSDDSERTRRSLTVSQLEGSVKTLAEEHVSKSILDGPILDVSCSPVGGGSTDDLTETTTVFECFAANEDAGDGKMRGYKYHATVNWTAGTYTYGLGAP
ncbi:MAG: DUF2510 domain-containing protein [Nocardiaceae bacterium]|nr:DUF2510 domain-containing protein [Nocardiaceae bacterium]